MCSSDLWLITYFLDKDGFLRFTPREWTPDLAVWRKLLGIGLPAGAEFGLTALYLFVVYAIIKPFGAEAQAGFGIGGRIVQAGFMPAVALGFAVAPVAGQNVGAKIGARVRETYKAAAILVVSIMAVFAVLCHIAPAALVGIFSNDPHVIEVGTEYLRIVSWNYAASGLVFVNSSMFQALGNTMPSLATSTIRLLVAVVPGVWLSKQPGFELHELWYLGVVSVTAQLIISWWLLGRELKKKGL